MLVESSLTFAFSLVKAQALKTLQRFSMFIFKATLEVRLRAPSHSIDSFKFKQTFLMLLNDAALEPNSDVVDGILATALLNIQLYFY